MDVFLLWHVHELPGGEEDAKLIGVYATAEDAERARQRVLPSPASATRRRASKSTCWAVGEDRWTEGFVTVTHEELQREFGDARDA